MPLSIDKKQICIIFVSGLMERTMIKKSTYLFEDMPYVWAGKPYFFMSCVSFHQPDIGFFVTVNPSLIISRENQKQRNMTSELAEVSGSNVLRVTTTDLMFVLKQGSGGVVGSN